MEFTPQTGATSPTDLLPSGLLCWVTVTFRGMKYSKETNGAYGDMEYTVFEGQPFAGRKVWALVPDPDDTRNSEKWRDMGMSTLGRMIEASGFVNPADPESYKKFNGLNCAQILSALDGKRIAVRISVEKGGDGYKDKNKIGDYLTPNPISGGNKAYLKLMLGDHGLVKPAAVPAAAQTTMFPQAVMGGAPVSNAPFTPAPSTQTPQAGGPIGQGAAPFIPAVVANPPAPTSPPSNVFNPGGPAPDWANKQAG